MEETVTKMEFNAAFCFSTVPEFLWSLLDKLQFQSA